MADEKTQLDSPIDVMYLIHKALSGEATRVQRVVEEMEEGDGLQRFYLPRLHGDDLPDSLPHPALLDADPSSGLFRLCQLKCFHDFYFLPYQ